MSDEWSDGEEAGVGARSFTLCERVDYDATRPEAPYTLHGVLSVLWLRTGFPGIWREPLWFYVEFFGEPGEYEFWLDVVLVEPIDPVPPSENPGDSNIGPFLFQLSPDAFVVGRSFCLPRLLFPAAGLYEFRVSVAGVADTLFAHRILVRG